ncbi:unnamed protein product [Discula destructiva]
MRPSVVVAPLAALASVASASIIARAATDDMCNMATGWGCWTVTDYTEYIPAIPASHHTMSFVAKLISQTDSTNCAGSTKSSFFCDDSAYKIVVEPAEDFVAFKSVAIYQKLYQTKAIAVIGGSYTLHPLCTVEPTSGDTYCTDKLFKVGAKLVGSIFPNGTKEGYTF